MLSSLGHAVSGRFAGILKPLGLEPREFALLLRTSLSQGATQQAIGEMLGIPPSRMVALVDSLEERRLLERRMSPSDRRARALHLTESGRLLLIEAMTAAASLERIVTAGLDEEQRTKLFAMLDLIAANLDIPPGVHGSHTVN